MNEITGNIHEIKVTHVDHNAFQENGEVWVEVYVNFMIDGKERSLLISEFCKHLATDAARQTHSQGSYYDRIAHDIARGKEWNTMPGGDQICGECLSLKSQGHKVGCERLHYYRDTVQ